MSTNQTIRKEVSPKIRRRRKGSVEKSRTARTRLLILMVGFNTLGGAARLLRFCLLVRPSKKLSPRGTTLGKISSIRRTFLGATNGILGVSTLLVHN